MWLEGERARGEALDEMITGGITQDEPQSYSLGGDHGTYGLLPLHCVVAGCAQLVAVAALLECDAAALRQRHAELQALALQLSQDSPLTAPST